jgi:nitrate reductase NapAB chaperone NapD
MISGIVVATKAESLAEVRRVIDALDYADVHYSDPRGRLVVTVEAPGIEASMDRVEAIGRFPHVLSVSLAQYCVEEGELEGTPELRREAVPHALKSMGTSHDRSNR